MSTSFGRTAATEAKPANRPFHKLFQLVIKSRKRIFIDTLEKEPKFTKFKGDTYQEEEDIASPKSREMLDTLVWWGEGGGELELPPTTTTTTIQRSLNFREIAELYLR